MKNLSFKICLIVLLSNFLNETPLFSQQKDVFWIHGFRSSSTTSNRWGAYQNLFTGQRPNMRQVPLNVYNSQDGLNTFKNDIVSKSTGLTGFGQPTNFAICHSMGGLAAAQLDKERLGNTQRFNGIITVGSPMDGLRFGNNLQNGQVNWFLAEGTFCVAAGPIASVATIPVIGPAISIGLGGLTALTLITELLFGDEIAMSAIGIGDATIDDLKEGSASISVFNSTPATSTPKISIWGNEDGPALWKLAGSNKGLNIEGAVSFLADVYLVAAIVNATAATVALFVPFVGWGVAASLYFASASWFLGWAWLNENGERSWNALIGANETVEVCVARTTFTCTYDDLESCLRNPPGRMPCAQTCWFDPPVCQSISNDGFSDGLVKRSSQIGFASPAWNVTSDNIFEAEHTNHFSEQQPSNEFMTRTFNNIFNRRGNQFSL